MPLTNIFLITAYLSTGHVCANGKLPIYGITVAAPRFIPLGTHVKIVGMTNDFIVQDRTAKRFDGRIDIFMGTEKDRAKEWGIQRKRVIIK